MEKQPRLKTISPKTRNIITKPRVTFSNNGQIRFNIAVVNALGLTDGMQVLFHQDMDNLQDWYFSITDNDGFFIRKPKNKNYCITNSKLTCVKVSESINVNSTFHCNVETTSKNGLFAIATKTFVVSTKK